GLVQIVAKGEQVGDTDYVVESYHHGRGRVSIPVWITKFFAAIITMMSGGSVGREGPIIFAGATAGSTWATLTGQSPVGMTAAPYEQFDDDRDAELIRALQETVWETVAGHSHTGIDG
ncbi:MAG: chloride channel protein, partial [Planctomycetota bacterium]